MLILKTDSNNTESLYYDIRGHYLQVLAANDALGARRQPSHLRAVIFAELANLALKMVVSC